MIFGPYRPALLWATRGQWTKDYFIFSIDNVNGSIISKWHTLWAEALSLDTPTVYFRISNSSFTILFVVDVVVFTELPTGTTYEPLCSQHLVVSLSVVMLPSLLLMIQYFCQGERPAAETVRRVSLSHIVLLCQM